MTHPTSSPNLRLVGLDDEPSSNVELLQSARHEAERSAWQAICVDFTTATGVELEFFDDSERPGHNKQLWACDVPSTGPYSPGMLTLKKRANSRLKREKVEASQALAEHLGSLVQQLQQSQKALREREAELATAIPLIVRSDEEPTHLAKRYTAILEAAARAVECDAAAVYILDDNTQAIKLRCHFGLMDKEFTAPPRRLCDSQADIYALAGQAVVLTEISDLEEWCIPGKYSAAVCVPISTATMPLGTFWIYSQTEREFSDPEVNIIEVVAGRIATELEREILLREQGILGVNSHASDAIEWQQAQLPRIAPPVGDWVVAARPSTRSRLHGDHYHWYACNDDRTSLTLSSTYESGIPAALTAATIGGLTRQHANDPPAERLHAINSALWEGSNGDHNVAMFCGALNQSGGGIDLVAAGQVHSFIVRPHSWETIQVPNGQPLGCQQALDRLDQRSAILQSGDMLLVLTGRPRRQPKLANKDVVNAGHYAEALLLHSHLPVDELTTLLASLWESHNSPWEMPPAIMIAKYRG